MLHSAHCSMLADRDILCCNLVLSKTLNCLTSMNLLQAVCQTVHSRIRLPCFRYRSYRIWSASSRPRSVSVELPLCRSAASLGNCEAYGTQEARRNTARLPAASEDWRRENRRRNTSHLSLTSMRQRPKIQTTVHSRGNFSHLCEEVLSGEGLIPKPTIFQQPKWSAVSIRKYYGRRIMHGHLEPTSWLYGMLPTR